MGRALRTFVLSIAASSGLVLFASGLLGWLAAGVLFVAILAMLVWVEVSDR